MVDKCSHVGRKCKIDLQNRKITSMGRSEVGGTLGVELYTDY